MDQDKPYNLNRFVAAQEYRGAYNQALSEMRAGCKKSHWIWFIFPQIAGLSKSNLSTTYAIASMDEAMGYLAHPVLGFRLGEISQAIVDCPAAGLAQLFGKMEVVDRHKLHSSMTLFKLAIDQKFGGDKKDGDDIFEQVLAKYFDGKEHEKTVQILRDLKEAT